MLIGYARVSTQDQNVDLQKDALFKAGCNGVYFFTDMVWAIHWCKRPNGYTVFKCNVLVEPEHHWDIRTNEGKELFIGGYEILNPTFDFPVAFYPHDRRFLTKKNSQTRITPLNVAIVVTKIRFHGISFHLTNVLGLFTLVMASFSRFRTGKSSLVVSEKKSTSLYSKAGEHLKSKVGLMNFQKSPGK